MKILHVPATYHPVLGGAELMCRRVSEVLADLGHQVHVATANVESVNAYYSLHPEAVKTANELVHGVRVKRLPFIDGFYRSASALQAWLSPATLPALVSRASISISQWRLSRLLACEISDLQPDVVMAMPHYIPNVSAVIGARRRIPFPLVVIPMIHEHDPEWCASSMKRILEQADAVIALTAHEANVLHSAYGLASSNIFVASVGIDLEDPGPPIEHRPDRVVFLGRKARSKGIDSLVDAMGTVWRSEPEAELWIAGARLPETEILDRQIASLAPALRKRVKNLDAISESEKFALLRSARCVVLPSKIESFGIVLLEAWTCATPVVTWDLPVARCIVEHGRTGLLADPSKGTQALSEAILQLLQNTDRAELMGRNGREHAAASYTWEKVAEIYLRAYRHAIANAVR